MELNEWNFALAIDRKLAQSDEARFSIMDETTNTLTDLVVMDQEDGEIYRISDEESILLLRHLMADRELIYEVDYLTNEIVYRR